MIEFWLTFNNGAEKLRLPVPPAEYKIFTGNNHSTVNIHELGEFLLMGKRKLKTMSISSYFPLPGDPIAQYTGYPSPEACVDQIAKWRDSGKPIRVLIVGDSLKINEAMAIECFEPRVQRGPQDVYFTLELREFRFSGRMEDGNGATPAMALLAAYTGGTRPSGREPPATYVVREGEDLWTIARTVYGDGSRLTELKNRNDVQDEFALAAGTVLYL
ncbi:LysM peptidoglycan-binding domain-containing protein [Gorillibacterium sp. sgz5001074]|uniref:LysM peptidoglycan-binding domain-containing protein n=1 Tax=Gorillibacterium sp. sgz5001074 TaxID=3446695 RepID=UPI003F66D61C